MVKSDKGDPVNPGLNFYDQHISTNKNMCIVIVTLILGIVCIIISLICKHTAEQIREYKTEIVSVLAGMGIPSLVKGTLNYLKNSFKNS